MYLVLARVGTTSLIGSGEESKSFNVLMQRSFGRKSASLYYEEYIREKILLDLKTLSVRHQSVKSP